MTNKFLEKFKLFIYIVFLITIDQLTKYWATNTLKDKDDIVIIKDVLYLHYLDGGNTGGAWGIFSKQTIFLVILSVIAMIFLCKFINNIIIMSYNYSLKKSIVVLKYLLTLLIAGALGNFIDRILHHFVIDFIYFKLINFPVFNVADIYASISCVLIIIVSSFFITDEEFSQVFSFKLKRNKNDK